MYCPLLLGEDGDLTRYPIPIIEKKIASCCWPRTKYELKAGHHGPVVTSKISFSITPEYALKLTINGVNMESDRTPYQRSYRNCVARLVFMPSRTPAPYVASISAGPVPYARVAESLAIEARMGLLVAAILINGFYCGRILRYQEGVRLLTHLSGVGPSAPEPTQRLQIALAITYALCTLHHAGYLHGDLKEENIIIQFSRELRGILAVLLDYEFAKQAPGEASFKGTHRLGTFGYMAPEVLAKEYSKAGDIYALSRVFIKLFCFDARWAFQNAVPDVLQQEISNMGFALEATVRLSLLIENMSKPSRTDRPQCEEVATQLEGVAKIMCTPLPPKPTPMEPKTAKLFFDEVTAGPPKLARPVMGGYF
jgi:hypothetical protein